MTVSKKYQPLLAGLFVAALTTAPISSVSARDVALYTGYTSSQHADYSYVGAVVPLTATSLEQDSVLARAWLSYQNFDYQSGSSTIKASGPVYEAAVGYQSYFSKTTRVTGYVGAVHRNISLSPNDPTSNVTRKKNGTKVQLELWTRPISQFDLSVIASHTDHLGDTWIRIRPAYVINDKILVGPEVIKVKGESYDKYRYGVAVEGLQLADNVGISLALGHEKSRLNNSASGTYGTITLSTRF